MSDEPQAAPRVVPLVVPAHGQGQLVRGGVPGVPNSGSKIAAAKAQLRKRLRRVLGKTLSAVERQLDTAEFAGSVVPFEELTAIANVAARYGVGTQDETVHVDEQRYVVHLPPRRSLSAVLASMERGEPMNAGGELRALEDGARETAETGETGANVPRAAARPIPAMTSEVRAPESAPQVCKPDRNGASEPA